MYDLRLIKEKSVDTVDDGIEEKELSMEKEYQRVSISGEEKCGVRRFFYSDFHQQFELQLLSNFNSVHTHFYSLCPLPRSLSPTW